VFVETASGIAPSGPFWELLRNAFNIGFVASVNRGMAHRLDHDVVLLNSDTEVPPGWLQRLRKAAYQRDNIGTVTPFSNCGSLASYPVPNMENGMPDFFSVEQLDHLFQAANAGVSVDIPTGVGFCLFIRRDCLNDTGTFDEVTFGKGYGEENDFCLRASKRGWSHVLAADCFVFHKGRCSFGEEKDARVKQAYALLVERHSRYPALIQRHFTDDPARPYRLRVDLLRLISDVHGILLVVTSVQSPTDRTIEPFGTLQTLQLSPVRSDYFTLHWLNASETFKLWFRLPEELDKLHELLRALPIRTIQGDQPSWLRLEQSALIGIFSHSPPPLKLFDLVARHGTLRLSGWSALQQPLAAHISCLSGSRLLQPLAAMLPQSVRARVRGWIKANRA